MIGLSPIAEILFFSQSGDGASVTLSNVSPAYLGAPSAATTVTFAGLISKLFTSDSKLSTDGFTSLESVPLNLSQAEKSLATPIWEAASTLFGVSPISRRVSVSRPRYSFAGVPTTASAGRTIIPS